MSPLTFHRRFDIMSLSFVYCGVNGMNNEEKILEMLGAIQYDISSMKTDISELKTDVAELKTDVAGLKADMVEVKTNINYLWEDVRRIGERVEEHDVILKNRVG